MGKNVHNKVHDLRIRPPSRAKSNQERRWPALQEGPASAPVTQMSFLAAGNQEDVMDATSWGSQNSWDTAPSYQVSSAAHPDRPQHKRLLLLRTAKAQRWVRSRDACFISYWVIAFQAGNVT